MSEDRWKKVYYIATCIIAVIAVLGFVSSINSSREVSEALRTIKNGLITLTEPLMLLEDYQWVVGGENEIVSKDNPPIGVILTYKNVSGIPVQIHKSNARYFYGEKELNEVTQKIGSDEGASVIAPPQGTMQLGTIQKDLFVKYLSTPKDFNLPPYFEVQLDIVYSRVNSQQKYQYRSRHRFLFDIRAPKNKIRQRVFEESRPL